jgi:hypothetical protein
LQQRQTGRSFAEGSGNGNHVANLCTRTKNRVATLEIAVSGNGDNGRVCDGQVSPNNSGLGRKRQTAIAQTISKRLESFDLGRRSADQSNHQ